MLRAYLTKRFARRSYNWKPAVDLSNPRIAAALSTFAAN